MTKKQRILNSLEQNPNRLDHRIALCLTGVCAADVKKVRDAGDYPESKDPKPDPCKIKGFSLKKGERILRVMDKKPNASIKPQFRKLTKGNAYTLPELSEKWGVSESLIKSNAKVLKCFKAVEVAPDEWEYCVLHPETAEEYK